MPLIPAKRVELKDTLACRIDRAVHERLKQYATFIHSPKEYVVTQALERLFRSDKDFAQWLASGSQPSEDLTDVPGKTAEPVEVEDQGVVPRKGGRG